MNSLKTKIGEYLQLREQLMKRLDQEIGLIQETLDVMNNGSPVSALPVQLPYKGKSVLGRRPWSEQDVSQLLSLVRRKPIPDLLKICKALHRTPASVLKKLLTLRDKGIDIGEHLPRRRKTKRGGYSHTHKRHKWTREEKLRMIELAEKGVKDDAIAKELGLREPQISGMRSWIKHHGM